MKKILILCVFAFISLCVGALPLDFVVLLDISESMFPYFDDTVNYLIGDLLTQHLVSSDGFHLLTFADSPEIELTLDIENGDEISKALDRILLLQPLGQYTDLVSALKFVYSHTSTLRQESKKKILVLTDGIHDPPPGSRYPVGERVYKEVASEVVGDIRKKGWDITLVQFPTEAGIRSAGEPAGASAGAPAGAASGTASGTGRDAAVSGSGDSTESATSGGVDLYAQLSSEPDVAVVSYAEAGGDTTHRALGAPELIFPLDVGRVGYRFTLPFTVRNLSSEKILIELTELVWNGVDILIESDRVTVDSERSTKLRARVRIPSSVEPGPLTMELTAGFADELRIYPRTGSVSITLKGAPPRGEGRSLNLLPLLGYFAIGLAGIVVLTLIVFALRALIARTFSSTGVPIPRASRGGHVRERAIEMYVEGQNPNIGTRNVNYIRRNGSATVGGGFSTFLIYMYKLPARIALISRKDESYTFKPLKKHLFENPETISDCLGKEIIVLSENGRKISIRFRRYVSALERINRIMRLVEERGKSDDEEGLLE